MTAGDRVLLADEGRSATAQLHAELAAGVETPCQSHPDLWFSSSSVKDTRQAVRLCRTECPLLDICRAAGLENDERFGVWGGLHSPDTQPLPRGDDVE